MTKLAVSIDAPNGRSPRRVVTLTYGDKCHTDTCDPLSGFERAKVLDRAASVLGVGRHLLGDADGAIVQAAQHTKDQAIAPPAFTRLLTGRELLALDLKPRFLVRGVMVEGQPMITGGRSKVLKTSIAVDLALSLGSRTPFLGRFDAERVAVGFWSGESGAATIRETAKRIAESKGISLANCDVSWCFDLPRLSQAEHLDFLAETIRGQGIKVAILDPLYLALLSPETASGASNLFLMGSMLQRIFQQRFFANQVVPRDYCFFVLEM